MKLCMIGSRGHCSYVFESLKESDVELTAVSPGCADAPDPLVNGAAQCGFSPKIYDADYRRMLDEQQPDIVCVDGPFERHAEMCVEALNRKIHVFCEKPIALTLTDLEKIETAYRPSGVKLMSMVGLRYEPAFQYARKLVQEGAVGEVKLIQARKSYKLGTRPEFYKRRDTYGGTIPWVGSHALDWILYFGGGDFESIWAVQTRIGNFGNGALEIAAQCQFRMTNGILAQASLDYLRPAAAPTHGDDRVRVAGTRGVIEVAESKVVLIDAAGKRELAVPEPERKIFTDFVLDAQGVRPALTGADETFRLTRGCLLAREAADRMQLINANNSSLDNKTP